MRRLKDPLTIRRGLSVGVAGPYIVLYIVLPLSQRRDAAPAAWRRTARLSVVTAAAGATLAGFAVPAGARTGPPGDPFGFIVNPPPGVAAPENPAAQSLMAPGSGGNCPAASLRARPHRRGAEPASPPRSWPRSPSCAGSRRCCPSTAGRSRSTARAPTCSASRRRRSGPGLRCPRPRRRAVWSNLGKGQLVSTSAAARRLHLAAGQSYPVSAAVQADAVRRSDRAERDRRGCDREPRQVRSARAGARISPS